MFFSACFMIGTDFNRYVGENAKGSDSVHKETGCGKQTEEGITV